MKMVEAVKMPQMRHAKILPHPQAASACRRPAAAEGPPILMVGGSAPPGVPSMFDSLEVKVLHPT